MGGFTGFPAKALGPGSDIEKYIFAACVVPKSRFDPEFCAVQRMNVGPDARWPIAVITPPSNIRFTPVLEIELVDKAGKPISGSEFILKHPTSGKEISLGTTDADGKLVRTDLSYGDFELVQIVPEGYSSKTTSHAIQISGVNNSYNHIRIVNTKEIP